MGRTAPARPSTETPRCEIHGALLRQAYTSRCATPGGLPAHIERYAATNALKPADGIQHFNPATQSHPPARPIIDAKAIEPDMSILDVEIDHGPRRWRGAFNIYAF